MSLKDNPLIFLTRKMWKYSEGNRRNVLLYFTMFTASNIVSLLEPLVVALLLNIVQQQGITAANVNSILMMLSFFILLEVGFWALHGPARVIENSNAFLVKANYKKRMLRGIMALPMKWHTEHHSGDTIDKIEKGGSSLSEYSYNTWRIIRIIVGMVSSYIILVLFNVHSAYIAGGLMLFSFLIVLKFDKRLMRNWGKLYRADNAIAAKVYDVISNIITIVILRLESLSSKSIMRKILAPYSLYKSTSKLNEIKWFLVTLLGVVMLILVLASYIITSLASGSLILVGTLYALYGYVYRIRNVFFEFAFTYSDVVRWKTAIHNAEEISKEFHEKSSANAVDLRKPWKNITIDKLSFNYRDVEGELHLNNVSLEIKRGEKIALVGESGGGKTTFLKLIRALYVPKHVSLTVNGNKFENFDALASNITLVPQDPELFDATIKENITMGQPYKIKKIRKYTDMARFTSVAEKLPKKFNSHVKERGVNLSTGEKQRLALARGLLAAEKTPMLLLDEPTSSVDPTNEILIYKNIFSAFRDKTILSSVHRLHLLSQFNRIYVFKGGRIVASGTLNEVMKSGEFRKMWKKYSKKEPIHERF